MICSALTPSSRSVWARYSTRVGSSSCRQERLTAMLNAGYSSRKNRTGHRSPKDQRPAERIMPFFSSSAMNSSGGTLPNRAHCQRLSASAPQRRRPAKRQAGNAEKNHCSRFRCFPQKLRQLHGSLSRAENGGRKYLHAVLPWRLAWSSRAGALQQAQIGGAVVRGKGTSQDSVQKIYCRQRFAVC